MTVGFVMLAHTALNRAADVAHGIAAEGCPVVIHVDKRTPRREFDSLVGRIASESRISLAERFSCDWGTWSLVAASRGASEQLLAQNPGIRHVVLISGACLPIKPIAELKSFLSRHPGTDFIESVTVEDVPWTAGGLSKERFTLSFPFAWKRNRRLFDAWVEIQRSVGRKRPVPLGVTPHLGSQWWCLSRETLEKILDDPERPVLDRYFQRVWIPDESYFQTLVRRHGTRVESRSLTLSKFDFQGKPHVFYDDHLGMLADSPAYFARKIWPGAKRLYGTFLSSEPVPKPMSNGVPGSFADRIFGEAVHQRTSGRSGLAMAGRYPREGFKNGVTAAPYAVFHGFDDVFKSFAGWVESQTGSRTHGHLFAPDRAEFSGNETMWAGALPDSAALRDYDPEAFLRNLIWNTQGEHQSFLLSPRDNLKIGQMLARDRNATVFVISGAWIIPLLHSGRQASEVRAEAARLQAEESRFIERFKERRSFAKSHIWTLADVLERPSEPLQHILDDLTGTDNRMLSSLPRFSDLTGLKELCQSLRNAGMNPYLAGELSGLALPDEHEKPANVIRLR